MLVRCPSCERNVIPDDSDVELRATDVPAVRRLLQAEQTSRACPECDQLINHLPVVSITGDGWQFVAATGTPMTVEQLAAHAAAARKTVIEKLSGHVESFATPALAAHVEGSGIDFAKERFTEWTSEVVAAWQVASSGDLPGLGDVMPPAVMSGAHALALFALAGEVDGKRMALAAVLEQYVQPGLTAADTVLLLATSRGQFGDPADGDPGPSPVGRWAISAVIAAAALSAGVPDPDPAVTARDYLLLETANEFGSVPGGYDTDIPIENMRQLLNVPALTSYATQLINMLGTKGDQVVGALIRCGWFDIAVAAAGASNAMSALPLDRYKEMLEDAKVDPDSGGIATAYLMSSHALVSSGRVGDLIELGKHAVLHANGPNERARVLVLLGASLKELRRPTDFIDIAGEEPAEWEADINDKNRLALANERSNAVRLLGDSRRALAILDEVAWLVEDEDDRIVYDTNRAILLRETGHPDAALKLLDQVAPRVTTDDERFQLAQAYMATNLFIGRSRIARDWALDALKYATGPRARHALQLQIAVGFDEETNLDDEEQTDFANQDPLGIIAVGSRMVGRLERGRAVPPEAIEGIRVPLRQTVDAALERGDKYVARNGLRVLAALLDIVDFDNAKAVWVEVIKLRGDANPDPVEFAAIAHHLFVEGDLDSAREFTAAIPYALDSEVGGIQDIAEIVDITGRLRRQLRKLADDALANTPFEIQDLLMAGELQRDALGQAIAARDRSRGDDESTNLTLDSGDLHVLEWIECTNGTIGVRTTLRADGTTSVDLLDALPDHAPQTARHLPNRLSQWATYLPGDPLEWEPWQEVVAWLRNELDMAREGDHLLVFENSALAGLPWHAIPDAAWTMSYSPGWRAAMAANSGPQVSAKRIGHISIPALGEAPDIETAFEAATQRTETWAARRTLDLRTATGTTADRDAVLGVIANTDLTTIHCHGLSTPATGEMSLMVAASDRLPPQSSAALKTRPQHRLAWRDLQNSPSAPHTVLSAACSSGVHMIEGLGDRLGLYAGLRHAGTQTVIAPAWDCIATDVIPMLEQIREQLNDGVSARAAVRATAREALKTLPSWRALVLALEGDWR